MTSIWKFPEEVRRDREGSSSTKHFENGGFNVEALNRKATAGFSKPELIQCEKAAMLGRRYLLLSGQSRKLTKEAAPEGRCDHSI